MNGKHTIFFDLKNFLGKFFYTILKKGRRDESKDYFGMVKKMQKKCKKSFFY